MGNSERRMGFWSKKDLLSKNCGESEEKEGRLIVLEKSILGLKREEMLRGELSGKDKRMERAEGSKIIRKSREKDGFQMI